MNIAELYAESTNIAFAPSATVATSSTPQPAISDNSFVLDNKVKIAIIDAGVPAGDTFNLITLAGSSGSLPNFACPPYFSPNLVALESGGYAVQITNTNPPA